MNLICLNVCGGQIYNPLIRFIKNNSKNTDVFCLQEVFNGENDGVFLNNFRVNIFTVLSQTLPDFNAYFSGAEKRMDKNIIAPYGLAMFIKKSYEIYEQGDLFIYKHRYATPCDTKGFVPHAKNLQHLITRYKDRKVLLANMHGLYINDEKTDIPERIEQSKKIIAFMNAKNFPKVLCGDFNISPDTESVKMLEAYMRNINKECHVKSTRDDDYVFVSSEIKVKVYEVMKDDVSDHLPLHVEFDI